VISDVRRFYHHSARYEDISFGVKVLRVFENRMLRKLLRSKTDEVTRYWKRLHNEEHYDVYFSLNIIRVNKPRSMRWAGHVANMETGEMHSKFW